jgi:hypothetical protein
MNFGSNGNPDMIDAVPNNHSKIGIKIRNVTVKTGKDYFLKENE